MHQFAKDDECDFIVRTVAEFAYRLTLIFYFFWGGQLKNRPAHKNCRVKSVKEHVCQIGKADFWESENRFPRGGGADHRSHRLTLMRSEQHGPRAIMMDGFSYDPVQCNAMLAHTLHCIS